MHAHDERGQNVVRSGEPATHSAQDNAHRHCDGHVGGGGERFGGGVLIASAALAVCRKVGDEAFLGEVRRKGQLIADRLDAMAVERERIVGVRGRGLIWGVELSIPAADAVAAALEQGLLLCGAGPNVVRIVPPLTIDDSELEEGLAILDGVLQ